MPPDGNFIGNRLRSLADERERRANTKKTPPDVQAALARDWMGTAAAPVSEEDTELTEPQIKLSTPKRNTKPVISEEWSAKGGTIEVMPEELMQSASISLAENRVSPHHQPEAVEDKKVALISVQDQRQRVLETANKRVNEQLAQDGMTPENLRTILEARLDAAQEEAQDIQDQSQLLAQNGRQQQQITAELEALQANYLSKS